MTEFEYEQILEVFEPVKTVDEVKRINNDIDEIDSILSTCHKKITKHLYTLLQ